MCIYKHSDFKANLRLRVKYGGVIDAGGLSRPLFNDFFLLASADGNEVSALLKGWMDGNRSHKTQRFLAAMLLKHLEKS